MGGMGGETEQEATGRRMIQATGSSSGEGLVNSPALSIASLSQPKRSTPGEPGQGSPASNNILDQEGQQEAPAMHHQQPVYATSQLDPVLQVLTCHG